MILSPLFLSSVGYAKDPVEVRKVALNESVKNGEEIDYLIQIKNNSYELTNVTVEDIFNRPVEFVSASPMPEADGIWMFAKVIVADLPEDEDEPDWRTLIRLRVLVPELDFEFGMDQGVSGAGYVNIKNDLKTTYQSYVITNCVNVTFFNETSLENETVSDCVGVSVINFGTELSTREHGSGVYESADLVRVKTENKLISMEKDMSATYSPTKLGLYNNRSVTYSSRWTEEAKGKNRVTGASLSESYRYATFIDRESMMLLDENRSVMEFDSDFDGMGHIGVLKMPTNSSTVHDTPTIEIREAYIGSFKILGKADGGKSSVSYEKTATGSGLAAGDRRVGESQRSYESGTGAYDSEEIIKTSANSITKNISLVYAPANLGLADGLSINASMRWKEGLYSRTAKVSYIGEEYTSLEYLYKDTLVSGLNEMHTDASFEGRARYRAAKEDVDLDEQYDGDYSIQRNIVITGVPRYDRPNLNVTKSLDRIAEEPIIDVVDETLAGERRYGGIMEATYTIRVENDGNRDLSEVYVEDLFPTGARYIRSSRSPWELTEASANWSLAEDPLPIGVVETIELTLDVTDCSHQELLNKVEASGEYDGNSVRSNKFSNRVIDWFASRPNETLSVGRTIEFDPMDPMIVWYRIFVSNNDNVTRAARVTDWLPTGMDLVNSSIPFASYENGVVIWNLDEIGPSETKKIEFSARAPGNGRFTNSVEVDFRHVDGPTIERISATSVIEVGAAEDECGMMGCGIWQTPNWEFEHFGLEMGELTYEQFCEQFT